MSANSKKGFYVALVWVGSALFAVLLALFIGNLLGDAAEKAPQSGGVPPLYEYSGNAVEAADAIYFELNGHTDSSVSNAASAVKNGADISCILRNARGTTYRSAVSYAVDKSEGGLFDLAALMDIFKSKDIRVIGCFYSEFGSAKTDRARSAAIEYEASLIAEAFDAGVDEILVFGLPTDKEGIALSSELFKKAREKATGAIIGAAFGYKLFESEDAAYAIDTYHKFADFCAVDTSGALRAGTNAASVVSPVLYYFERYPLRVLLEDMGESDRNAQKEALGNLGIYDIQSVPIAALPVG